MTTHEKFSGPFDKAFELFAHGTHGLHRRRFCFGVFSVFRGCVSVRGLQAGLAARSGRAGLRLMRASARLEVGPYLRSQQIEEPVALRSR